MINLAKGRYRKNPTEELKVQILDWYGKVINPAEKMTNDLKELGIIKKNHAPNSGPIPLTLGRDEHYISDSSGQKIAKALRPIREIVVLVAAKVI